ncbi:hypothetical protein SALBM311S_07221 [Streptomyces alboniger]
MPAAERGRSERTPAAEREGLPYEAACPDGDIDPAAKPEVAGCFPPRRRCRGWAVRVPRHARLVQPHFFYAFDVFDVFNALVRQWAEAVDATARSGWGLLGLPVRPGQPPTRTDLSCRSRAVSAPVPHGRHRPR